jgi:hypothetical protein
MACHLKQILIVLPHHDASVIVLLQKQSRDRSLATLTKELFEIGLVLDKCIVLGWHALLFTEVEVIGHSAHIGNPAHTHPIIKLSLIHHHIIVHSTHGT